MTLKFPLPSYAYREDEFPSKKIKPGGFVDVIISISSLVCRSNCNFFAFLLYAGYPSGKKED
jgi:hypothetical protein